MEKKQRKLSLSVEHEEEPEQAIELKAFLFSRKQELLEVAEVKDQKADFKTKVSDPSSIRVLILPDREQIPEDASIEELKYKFNAYEPVIRLTEKEDFHILPIPWKYNNLWFLQRCRVRGKVSKMFEIHGIEEERPLCDVRVHICEVDRLRRWIPKIPDDIIVRIPDIVFNPDLPIPQPIPDPPKPFPPGPDPYANIFEASDRPIKKRSLRRLSTEKEAYAASEQLQDDDNITKKLLSYEPNVIRDVIRNNFDLFHPLLCYIPWIWPYFYRCDEIALEYTNINGLFDTEVTYWLLGDKPDLYFWVEAKIDGVWTTVYKPPISCNTYWNYECGDEVDITVTDPRVQWGCTDILDGEIVWVKTVGHRTSVHHIQQTNGAGSPIQNGVSRNRIGLTDTHEATGDYLRPFGQRLYFLLQFSSGLPKDRYTYYRWSYKKIKNADLSNASSSKRAFNNPMHKQYTFEYRDSSGDLHFDENSFKLGPFSQGGEDNLYLIPPPSPYDPPVNASETNAHWDQNTKSIAFDSSLEGDGLYEFTLELFDDSGNKITDIPKELFQIPHYDDFTPSINAPSQYLSSTGSDTCDAFKMVMRIDNQQCEAEIFKLGVDGSTADPGCCGFVEYADDDNTEIEISFRAYHPNNFARFDFDVEKGTCGSATGATGFVISDVNGFNRNSASVFSRTFSPNELLGSCASEGKAAFAESLKVHALATNGNHVINGYDSPHRLAAFALEPETSS